MTHADKVLALLADGLWHDHREGYALNVMLHSRVADLRRRGYVIECEKTGRQYRYRLVSSPSVGEPQPARPAAGSEPARLAAATPEPSPTRGDGQLSLVEAVDAVADVLPAAASAPRVIEGMLDHVDEAYASRIADRLRAEDAYRRLRLVS